jgi:predicted nucleotidyltransferase
MLDAHMIEKIKDILIKTYNPVEIYIFGSYAWGNPDEESDLDLLVVIDEFTKDWHQTLVDGHRALAKINFSKDLLVYSKKQFEEFSKDQSRFSYKIKNKGKLIYARA